MRGATLTIILLLSVGLTTSLLPGAAAADPDKALHLKGPADTVRNDTHDRLEAADKLAHVKLPLEPDDGAHEPETVDEPNPASMDLSDAQEPDLRRLHNLLTYLSGLLTL